MAITQNDVLYSKSDPSETGFLQVSDLHQIAWYRHGLRGGSPAVVLHGGPGGGSDPSYARYFNPSVYDVFLFDQRGCGKSTPPAEIRENTSQDLVADIEKLRAHFGVSEWHVFGGSWGSTLALLYAETHPSRVLSLTLRGIFLGRQQDIDWLYVKGANEHFPDAYDAYKNHIPALERNDIVAAYSKRLNSKNSDVRRAAAREWTKWEMSCSRLIPNEESILKSSEDAEFAAAFAGIECHYFMNECFLRPNQLLADAHKIQCPVDIVHGRYDVVCSPRFGWELHKAIPQSTMQFINASGHSMREAGISLAMRRAMDKKITERLSKL